MIFIVFTGQLERLNDFEKNDEAEKMILWDGHSDIGEVQVIDQKLIDFI